MTDAWVPVTSEPVRGTFDDDRFYGLSGLEHVRAAARGLVPEPPLLRLTGIRVTSAGPGRVTLRQPVSPWFQGPNSAISTHPLVEQALRLAAMTGAPPGVRVLASTSTANYIKTAGTEAEAFVAKAQIVSAGRVRCTTTATVEDALGRLLTHAVGQFVFDRMDEAPKPPATIERPPEPSYPTPDPPVRPLDGTTSPAGAEWMTKDGLTVLGAYVSGELPPAPVQRMMGIRLVDVGEGRTDWAMVASPWLSVSRFGVNPGPVAYLMNAAVGSTGGTLRPALGTGTSRVHVLNDLRCSFFRVAPADGRDIIARGRVVHQDDRTIVINAEAIDSDGKRVALGAGHGSLTELSVAREEIGPERVLQTVLFTDIVSSTERAATVGDAKWREVLESHHTIVRRQLQMFRGREVNTTGDGFLATFDSPARAVQCARAICDAADRAGIKIRTGVHLGECELLGTDVAGIAVHVARRVCDLGGPGDVLVTSTVREASAGSGLSFEARGDHELKGVPDRWQLYVVRM